jgi:hypothetical protein
MNIDLDELALNFIENNLTDDISNYLEDLKNNEEESFLETNELTALVSFKAGFESAIKILKL